MLVQPQRFSVGRRPGLVVTRREFIGTGFAALFFSQGGCTTPEVALGEGPREYAPTDYERVLARWTRTEHLITLSALDDLLTVTATFESWDFRWAYTIRYAHDYQLSTEQGKTMLDAALAETRSRHRFFVALYGNNRKYSDLNAPQSAWNVRLVDDRGSLVEPLEIASIAKPGPVERTYFPYASVWRRLFHISFPVSTPGGPSIASDASFVALRFVGPLGNEELRWGLQR
jgi:hypothetical protein